MLYTVQMLTYVVCVPARVGLYPEYKTKEKLRIVPFPGVLYTITPIQQ